jgi:putative hydrolase of HD superfamily
MAFLLEVDKLKTVLRRTPLTDSSRFENSAEHSWHLAVAALTLAEYAPPGTDVAHAIALTLVHDLVEIDAGDTFAYGDGQDTKVERETAAADRLFSVLPPDQAPTFREWWEEFEAAITPSARFANALDRLQPLLLNMAAGGGSWLTHGVRCGQVVQRMQPIRDWLPAAWPYVLDVIARATAAGLMQPDS